MKFGAMKPADAIGGVTVHSIRQNGFVLKKGTLITAAEALWKGHGEVMMLAIILIAAGTCLTIIRRTMRLATKLKEAKP